MKKVIAFIALALLLSLGATPAYAQPPLLPHAFYGSVTINGSPAPVGTSVEARGDGVTTGIDGNPTATTVTGIYGTSNPFESRLIVQGDIQDGATLSFYVNGVSTEQTAEWHSGDTTPLDLSVTIEEEEGPVRRGGAAAAAIYIDTNLFGTEKRFRIDSDGEIQETIEATSSDGMLTITILKDAIALDKDGDPLDNLTAEVGESPCDPPEDAHVIGLAYDFGPDGATFDPPISFTWSYDPDVLPEGVAQEDLVIAYCDEDDNEWVELDCVVDTKNHIITASVPHFTTFTIIGEIGPAAFTLSSLDISPSKVAPGEKVNISTLVANTGGMEGSYTVVLAINGVKEAEGSVTIAAGSSQGVSFSVVKEEGGIYRVVVDGLSGSFTVVAPAPPPPPPPAPQAAFSTSNLVISPAEADIGQTVTISLLVTNTGSLESTYEVTLEINNLVVDTKEVTIAADASKTVTFTTYRDAAGTYTVAINGLSGSFKVKEAPPPPPPEEEVVVTNWAVIGGIIGGVVIIVLLLYFLWWRRRLV